MGSLFKQIYRYTRPRAYRHNENLWPFTRITRAPSGEISALRYKGKTVPLVSLSALKNSNDIFRRMCLNAREIRQRVSIKSIEKPCF